MGNVYPPESWKQQSTGDVCEGEAGSRVHCACCAVLRHEAGGWVAAAL